MLSEVVIGPSPAAGGDGIGRLSDGRVAFVAGALPGERVAIEVTEERRDFVRGRVIRVLAPSTTRVDPPCPWVSLGCGGCGWQHVARPAQVPLKEKVVLDSLRRIDHLDATHLFSPPVITSPDGYRTTAHLALDDDGRPAYHRRSSHELVAVRGCGVAHPRLRELIDGVTVRSAPGVTLRVGVAGGERLVVVDPVPSPAGASRRGRRGGPSAGSWKGRGPGPAASAGSPTPTIVAPEDSIVVLPGQDGSVTEEVGGRRWRVSARSFFQAGPGPAGALLDAVDAAVGPLGRGDHLVDLYAGVGLLGGGVTDRNPGAALTSVESDPSAAADARENLADLAASIVCCAVGAWTPRPAATVIADPARPGLGRPGVGAVAATGASRLVLVSCDPASLARDTVLLSAAGYHLSGLQVVDLFPLTPHVETVTWFDRIR